MSSLTQAISQHRDTNISFLKLCPRTAAVLVFIPGGFCEATWKCSHHMSIDVQTLLLSVHLLKLLATRAPPRRTAFVGSIYRSVSRVNKRRHNMLHKAVFICPWSVSPSSSNRHRRHSSDFSESPSQRRDLKRVHNACGGSGSWIRDLPLTTGAGTRLCAQHGWRLALAYWSSDVTGSPKSPRQTRGRQHLPAR